MKPNKFSHCILLASSALVLFSCSSSSSNTNELIQGVKHLSFKESKNDRWGIISTDGKVIIADEFDNCPEGIYNDRFFLRDANGKYELMSVAEKPKSFGVYSQYLPFYEDVTSVVEPDGPISIIDKNGKEITKLISYKDKEIENIYPFQNGFAIIETNDELFGFIDVSGQIVIEPKYEDVANFSEGKAVVSLDGKLSVIDKTGKTLFTFKENVTPISSFNGGIIVCRASDNSLMCYDSNGEKTMKKISKYQQYFEGHSGNHIVSLDGQWGVINNDGETVVRPKYKHVSYANSDFMIVSDRGKTGIIDYKDDVLCDFEYDEILPFYNGSTTFAKSHNEYTLIDKKGKEVDKSKSYAKIEPHTIIIGKAITSEYVNYSSILSFFTVTDKGFGTYSFDAPISNLIDNYEIEENHYSNTQGSFLNVITFEDSNFECKLNITPDTLKVPIIEKVDSYFGSFDKIVGYEIKKDAKIKEFEGTIRVKSSRANYTKVTALLQEQLTQMGFSQKGETQYEKGNVICTISGRYGTVAFSLEQK